MGDPDNDDSAMDEPGLARQKQQLPVKHTFIHFEEPAKERTLRLGRSDPAEPRMYYASSAGRPVGEPRGLLLQQVGGLPEADEDSEPEPVAMLSIDVGATPETSPRHAAALEPKVPTLPIHLRTPIVLSDRLDGAPENSKMCSISLSLDALVEGRDCQRPSPSTSAAAMVQAGVPCTPDRKTAAQSPPARDAPNSPIPAWVSSLVLEGDGVFFSFQLRKADGVGLGLDIEPSLDNTYMLVRSIREGGAIFAWNKQCVEALGGSKEVKVGDKIVSVNGRFEVQGMLEEIKTRLLLKLVVVRTTEAVDACADQAPGWGKYGDTSFQETPRYPLSPAPMVCAGMH